MRTFTKIAERLPGGLRLRLIREYLPLLTQDVYYRNLLRLNLRAYFCIRPHYGPLRYRKADTVPMLYHITAAENVPSVLLTGLQNDVTRAVFLTDDPLWATQKLAYKHLNQPVLLKIDCPRMLQEDISFFRDEKTEHFWITESVPAKYIAFKE